MRHLPNHQEQAIPLAAEKASAAVAPTLSLINALDKYQLAADRCQQLANRMFNLKHRHAATECVDRYMTIARRDAESRGVVG